MIDFGNLTISTDMLIGFAAGAGITLVRGIVVKALIGVATTYLLVGGADLNELFHQIKNIIP